jgi:hypothetical protein
VRTMLRISIPVETGNKAIKDGTLERVMMGTVERLHPESTYFFPENGRRTCLMVVDLKTPADLPSILEPFFMELNAAVDVTPVMIVDDLKKGLGSMAEHRAALKV